MTNIITYDTLYDLLRKEKFSIDLQPIPQSFFKETISYLKEKELILKNQEKDTVFTLEIEKTRKQIENIKKLLKELYEKRERKIIDQALSASRTEIKNKEISLLPEEEQLYKELITLLTEYRENILLRVLSKKQPKPKEEPKEIKIEDNNNLKLIRFLTEIPKFIGTDLNVYGPFEREDLANLPKDIAKTLIEKKRAEEIRSEL